MPRHQRIRPCLWFDGQAEEAAAFYTSVFPHAKVHEITRYTESGPGTPGSVLTVTFSLDGSEFIALNGGPEFTFTEAISLSVDCADQAEVDDVWEKLLAGGGQESMCGWLKDRYGLSWQVVPTEVTEMMSDPDPARADRVIRAMAPMRRLDLATLRAAYRAD